MLQNMRAIQAGHGKVKWPHAMEADNITFSRVEEDLVFKNV